MEKNLQRRKRYNLFLGEYKRSKIQTLVSLEVVLFWNSLPEIVCVRFDRTPTKKRRRRSNPRGNATGADPAVSASCFILGTSPPPVRRRPHRDNIYFLFFLSFSLKIKGKEEEKGAETWSFIAWSRT